MLQFRSTTKALESLRIKGRDQWYFIIAEEVLTKEESIGKSSGWPMGNAAFNQVAAAQPGSFPTFRGTKTRNIYHSEPRGLVNLFYYFILFFAWDSGYRNSPVR